MFRSNIASAFMLIAGNILCEADLISTSVPEGCDYLVPQYCMLPFPNDFWRVKTDSGNFVLNFTENTFPIGNYVR